MYGVKARMRIPILVFLLALSPILVIASPSTQSTQPTLATKCDALLDKWQPKLSTEHFAVTISPPFVIAGDGGANRLTRYRDGTILPAMRALQKQFFAKPPSEPILILLFESEEPYRRLAKDWFGDTNVAYFGYCRHDGVMLMNVSTGTGTLVHELVHALIAPDMPRVPSWFNEGLASLYEQSQFTEDGGIRGLKNWRLPALQRAIRQDKLRPLGELIADDDFYAEDRTGLNYAQARYVLMYLQEKGTLREFYKAFRAGVKDDSTGAKTFKSHIAPQELKDFESEWRDWVLHL
jgi:hypothetical protein